MTYDELRAMIDTNIEFWSGGLNLTPEDTAYCKLNLSSWSAHRAVADIHKPESRIDETLISKEVMVCGHCWANKATWSQAYRYVYPCTTIKVTMDSLE